MISRCAARADKEGKGRGGFGAGLADILSFPMTSATDCHLITRNFEKYLSFSEFKGMLQFDQLHIAAPPDFVQVQLQHTVE